jgi:hypothetical protein
MVYKTTMYCRLLVSRSTNNLPLSGERDDCVELAHKCPGSLPHLDVLAVGQNGGRNRGAQLGLGTGLGFVQR